MASIAGQPPDVVFLLHLEECSSKELTIVVSPAFDRKGRRRCGFSEVRLQGHDELICVSPQPLLDCSRILLRAGFDATAILNKVHVGSLDVVSMRARIGIAAQYDVMGDRFVRRQSPALISGSTSSEMQVGRSNTVPDRKSAMWPSHKGPGRTKDS
jgi:hypothetical protein